jgi:hypothetical protein
LRCIFEVSPLGVFSILVNRSARSALHSDALFLAECCYDKHVPTPHQACCHTDWNWRLRNQPLATLCISCELGVQIVMDDFGQDTLH